MKTALLLLTLLAPAAARGAESPDAASRSAQEVYASHAGAFGAAVFGNGTVDRIMDDYADDAFMILSPGPGWPTGVLQGKENIRRFFDGVIAEFRKQGTTFKMEGDPGFEKNVARFSWSARSPDHVFRRATDTLVVKDGKIAAQTFSAYVDGAAPAASAARLGGSADGEALRRHAESFRNGQVDAVVGDFAPDAVVLNSNGAMRGRDALHRFFQQALAAPNPTFKENFATTFGGIGFIEWSADGWPWGSDTFVYDSNGKIAIQTFDGFMTPTASP